MIKINLVAKYIPKEHKLIQLQFLALIGGFVLAIILSVVWIVMASDARDVIAAELEVEKQELQRLESVIAKNNEFKSKMTRRENILKTIDSLQEKRTGPRPILDYLNIVLPADVWLTQFGERDRNLTISGYSFSPQAVADLMRSVLSSNFFSNVELSEVQRSTIENEEVQRFTLTMHWDLESEHEKEGQP